MEYTVHGILQARILEWVAFPFSRGSSEPRDWTQVSHIAGGFITSWATRPQKWRPLSKSLPHPLYPLFLILINSTQMPSPLKALLISQGQDDPSDYCTLLQLALRHSDSLYRPEWHFLLIGLFPTVSSLRVGTVPVLAQSQHKGMVPKCLLRPFSKQALNECWPETLGILQCEKKTKPPFHGASTSNCQWPWAR